MTARCVQCGRFLKPYKPPHGVVIPARLTVDEFCSRSCCEAWHGIKPREGLKA